MLDLIKMAEQWVRQNKQNMIGNHDYLTNLAIEHVQADILAAMQMSMLGSITVFQGGTALRKIHGGGRFSEDLDFALSADRIAELSPEDVTKAVESFSSVLKARLPNKYGFDPSHLIVRPPDDPMAIVTRKDGRTRVSTWHISVPISLDRRPVRNRKIKVEIASIPAHTVEIRNAASPSARFMGLSHADLLVPTETLQEIIADKIVALVGRPHLKGRDLWDLAQFQTPDIDETVRLISLKIDDYQIGPPAEFMERLEGRMAEMRSEQNLQNFINEISRFSLEGAPTLQYARSLAKTADEHVTRIYGELKHFFLEADIAARQSAGMSAGFDDF